MQIFGKPRVLINPAARWKHLSDEPKSMDSWPHSFHHTTNEPFWGNTVVGIMLDLWSPHGGENLNWVLFLGWLDRPTDLGNKHVVFGIKNLLLNILIMFTKVILHRFMKTQIIYKKLTMYTSSLFCFVLFFNIRPLVEDYATRMGFTLKANHIPTRVTHQRKHETCLEQIQGQTLTSNSKQWLRWFYLDLVISLGQAILTVS